MLSINEFSAGHLKDVKELSLLLPRDQYGNTVLLAPNEGKILPSFSMGFINSIRLMGRTMTPIQA